MSLPNELFLSCIFIYLHSTDLLRAFGQLRNARLNALLYTYIRHIDLSTIDESSIERWLSSLLSLETNAILSLRVTLDRFDSSFSFLFPRLNRLDLRLTTLSEQVSRICVLTQLKSFSITLTCGKAANIKGLAPFIWHSDRCLSSVSTSNCFILDKDDFCPTPSQSLMINQNLTRLSLDLAHIRFVIVLMPFVPALEHLEVRLHRIYRDSSMLEEDFLQRWESPAKVKSLRFLAFDQLVDTVCFCTLVKHFSLSLNYLSFYMSTPQRFLMCKWNSLEQYLLSDLPLLKQVEFCVHSGMRTLGGDHRRKFDHWTRNEVISILHPTKAMTRFTMPFAFDHLEYVSNAFVDYHTNYNQSNVIRSFPSIVIITFYPSGRFNLGLFTFIQQTCLSLRQIRFKIDCCLSDDLIHNTDLTLPTVTKLCLSNVIPLIDSSTLRRLLFLMPHLQFLTAQRDNIAYINKIKESNASVLQHVIKITMVELNR